MHFYKKNVLTQLFHWWIIFEYTMCLKVCRLGIYSVCLQTHVLAKPSVLISGSSPLCCSFHYSGKALCWGLAPIQRLQHQ